MSKKPITRLVNIKPISISDIKTEQKEDSVFMGYTENIISQIVEAREEKEFTFICSQIQEFIEKENIDVCFVINKTELIDCLQEHQKLKFEIADLETKLAEITKKYELASCPTGGLVDRARNLEQQLAEKEKELKLSKDNEEMWFNWKELYYKEIQKLKQRLLEKDIELEKYNRITSYVLENKITQKEFNELFKKQTLIAIEQLEKVKETIVNMPIARNGYDEFDYQESTRDYCIEIISQKIKELKEGK